MCYVKILDTYIKFRSLSLELSAEDIVYSGPDPPTLSMSRECKIIWPHISESCNGVEEWGGCPNGKEGEKAGRGRGRE